MCVLTDYTYQAGSTTAKELSLESRRKNIETKAGGLNIPWRGDWSYFH